MKNLMVAVILMVAIAGFAQQKVRDVKNFKFADGSCYYINSKNPALPVLKDGYWGNCQVRWESDSKSKFIHITVNGVEKTVFLAGTTPDRQTQQYLLIKMSGEMLKAFHMSDPTPEQIKICINGRKAFEYVENSSLKVQDGDSPCYNCKGVGYFNSTKKVKVNSRRGDMYDTSKTVPIKSDCIVCKGTGKLPKTISIPQIKIID